MTELEFEGKRQSLMAARMAIISKTHEQVEAFVNTYLGDEFQAIFLRENGFDVQLIHDGKPVFGAGWSIYVDKDWDTHEVQVKANIGTCGSFEIGIGDAQEKKYASFACLLAMFSKSGLKDALLECYNACAANRKACDKLLDEYEQNQD